MSGVFSNEPGVVRYSASGFSPGFHDHASSSLATLPRVTSAASE